VDSFDYNMLSISQICSIGYNYLSIDVGVTIFRRSGDSVAFKCVLKDNLYAFKGILNGKICWDERMMTRLNLMHV
jgi:hypothetical protein